jgi:hypothetical protein
MLTGEALPGMQNNSGTRLQTQTSALGWLIDDLLFISGIGPDDHRQLAISCKSNVQVTSSGLPRDFVAAAWQQWSTATTGPMHRGRDRLMLVTRGRHPAFQALWADIKNWCTSTDPVLAIARIRGTAKHRKIFESIKSPLAALGVAIRDEDVVELIQHLLIVPLDFDLNVSEDQERAVAQCRRLLVSGALDEARDLWNALVDQARQARLGDGTIALAHLWCELRTRFMLNEHPNFASSWRLLKSLTNEYVGNIQLILPNGFSLTRTQDAARLTQSVSNSLVTVLYGDSGSGKSALVKATLDNNFAYSTQVWLGPDALNVLLSETERLKIGLAYPLLDVLKATAKQQNVLVIDAAEHLSVEHEPKVKRLITELLADNGEHDTPVWRVLIVGQTEAWADGRLQVLVDATTVANVELGPASPQDVQAALLSTGQLGWLAWQDDAVAVLTNLRALAWVMQAESHFQLQGNFVSLSRTAIADHLWKFWTGGRLTLQSLLMRLAEREASFEHSFALSELDGTDVATFESRPIQLPLRLTSRNRIEFQHDLAAEWGRFQRLKEMAHDTGRWAVLATNPLWTGALRMLGQFLLRERVGDRSAWDIALEAIESAKDAMPLAADVLLDALCLDPLAESLLTERAKLLLSQDGMRLDRLLRRFHHIATAPSGQPEMLHADPSLRLYMEAQYRVPIITRWTAVARFLAAHREQVANLMLPAVAGLCERWLTVMPVDLAPGVPTPYRKEFAEIALATARALQLAQGKSIIFLDDSEKPIYTAAFAGAPDLPEEVSAWALEVAQRRPYREDVAAKIAEHHRQRTQEHAERLRTDPEYRARHQQRGSFPAFIPSARELPPWPLGPQSRVERDFREGCTHLGSLDITHESAA